MVAQLAITWPDIIYGILRSPEDCPIAIAANRAFGMTEGCKFSDSGGEWVLEVYEQRYEVVGGALFACEFDAGRYVEPCTFELIRLDDADEDD